ncbi:MAG: flavin reductase family protein [Candidatus Gastranaerophilales bacterium]|nr:flavin reductase family protein [Candidatus Gastranaerophilales bacterium]
MSNFKEIKANEIDENTFKLIGSDWMLVTAEKEGKVNTMTASWGGFGVMWGKNVSYIVVRPQRFTKEFIDSNDSFTLSFFDEKYRKELAYLGSVSGRDEDKITKSGLKITEIEGFPAFKDAKLVIACKKLFAQPFEEGSFIDKESLDKWYPDKDLHTLYISEITNVWKK